MAQDYDKSLDVSSLWTVRVGIISCCPTILKQVSSIKHLMAGCTALLANWNAGPELIASTPLPPEIMTLLHQNPCDNHQLTIFGLVHVILKLLSLN